MSAVHADQKTDARIVRSRALLRSALVRLVLEHGYENVTIRQLTDSAGVGYATFFRHYADKDALLLSMLDDLLAELMTQLGPAAVNTIDASASGAVVFRHVQANADLYRVLLSSQRSVDLLPTALAVGMSNVLTTFRPKPGSVVPLDAAVNHLIRSFVALIEWWLAADMRVPPADMGLVFEALIMRPTREAAFEAVGQE